MYNNTYGHLLDIDHQEKNELEQKLVTWYAMIDYNVCNNQVMHPYVCLYQNWLIS